MSGPALLAEFFSAFVSGAYDVLTYPLVSAEIIVVASLWVCISVLFAVDDCRDDDLFECMGIALTFLGSLLVIVIFVWWVVQYGT